MSLEHLIDAPVTMVPTSALREGDLIRNNGCIMRINEVPESEGHAPDGNGAVYWYKATILHRFNGTIPLGWLDRDENGDRTLWTVQGNDLAKWARIEEGEKA
jgi:hypothetical protein